MTFGPRPRTVRPRPLRSQQAGLFRPSGVRKMDHRSRQPLDAAPPHPPIGRAGDLRGRCVILKLDSYRPSPNRLLFLSLPSSPKMKKIDWPSQSKIVVHFAEAPLGALVREALSLNTLLAAFFLGFGELPPVRVATEIPLKIDVCVLHPCAGASICASIAQLNALYGRGG